MEYLRVRNWERFQHYKHRNPPWIKLHTELLDNYEFSCLQDASKLLAMCLLLLAARTENRIPADPDWIRRKANLTGKVELAALLRIRFIEPIQDDSACLQDASALLASCLQSADSEKSRDRVEESRGEKPRKRCASVLPDDFQLNDVMRAYATTRLPKVDVEEVFQQFRDHHLTKGKTSKDWLASWRTWVGNCNRFGYPMVVASVERTPQLRFDANGRQIDAG